MAAGIQVSQFLALAFKKWDFLLPSSRLNRQPYQGLRSTHEGFFGRRRVLVPQVHIVPPLRELDNPQAQLRVPSHRARRVHRQGTQICPFIHHRSLPKSSLYSGSRLLQADYKITFQWLQISCGWEAAMLVVWNMELFFFFIIYASFLKKLKICRNWPRKLD